MTQPIFHITTEEQWQQAQATGIYQADSLASEGFIHCSDLRQVVTVANRFFVGQRSLVLLQIDPERLEADLKYDPVEGDVYPHLYGPLNLAAVVAVLPFGAGADGQFALPEALQS